ncbi:hypothetical protein VB716_03640 [Synechococcus sp. CCY9201]|jgi:hypothetical protein|uniref:hypothetical protein n=1 Tax=Synechococcus sp. CCY9201 TaxID=174697 RepID=UPI002B1F92DA|nr:hypothetical protein [Synechococcus sp. CCY9201]MEA5473308.1 hypothetical protein [Synechococcus sp. CCY9201]
MSDLDAFLRWNSGHLLENRTRGAYAEWLVHRALGLDPGEHRVASAYVFCLLAEQDPELVDPQDLSQWRFWVVPTGKLHGGRKSIGLQPLIRAYGPGISYEELPDSIEALRA